MISLSAFGVGAIIVSIARIAETRWSCSDAASRPSTAPTCRLVRVSSGA